MIFEDFTFQIAAIEACFFVIFLEMPIHFGEDPIGFGRAQDDLIAGLHLLFRDLFEVVNLLCVEVRTELQVYANQPVAKGQFEREIAALLWQIPFARLEWIGQCIFIKEREIALVRKNTGEGSQTVIPIVIAGNGEQVWAFAFVILQRGSVGVFETVLIFIAGGGGIHFIAAHNQHLPTRQHLAFNG